MRTSVYTFLLITCLLLTPCAVLAGADDSGLQVFELLGPKTTGMRPDAIKEDTGIAELLINLLPSPNGFYSITDFGALASGVTDIPRGFLAGAMFSDPGGEFIALEKRIPGGTDEIVYYQASGAITSEVDANASIFSSFFAAFDGGLVYIVNGDSFLSFNPASPTTSTLSKPWTMAQTACIWKNRLWVAEGSGSNTYLWYSAAQDYDNFTTPSPGGVFNISSRSGVKKLCPTNYGLYIMCDNDIYLMSGGDVPNSWRLDKLFTGFTLGYNGGYNYFATVIGNEVWFLTKTSSLFRISGTQIQLVSTIPQYYIGLIALNFSGCCSFKNKYFVLTNPPGNYGMMYDIEQQCWILCNEFSYPLGNTDNFYINSNAGRTKFSLKITPNFADSSAIYGKPVIYPWQWQSSYFTLDGNDYTQKEIDRIEFEYMGGTASVYIYAVNPSAIVSSYSKTFVPATNNRITTNVWEAPLGRRSTNKISFLFYSADTNTQYINYMIKKIRIYYRNLGSYGTTRSGY